MVKAGRLTLITTQPKLVNSGHHGDALGLVRVILARERVVVHLHAELDELLVDAFHVLWVAVHAAGGVRHVHARVPRLVGGGPVAGVKEDTVANIGLQKGGVAIKTTDEAVHWPRTVPAFIYTMEEQPKVTLPR